MAKTLTGDGKVIDEDIKIEDMDLPAKEPVKKEAEKKEVNVNVNCNPKTEQRPLPPRRTDNPNPFHNSNGVHVMRKSTYFLIIVGLSLFFIVFTVGVIWFNINLNKVSQKDFSTNVPVNVAGSTTNNQYNNTNVVNIPPVNNTVNVNIDLDDAIVNRIANDVLKVINQSLPINYTHLNSTNSSV